MKLDFKSFLNELFNNNGQANGYWEPPLTANSSHYTFRYNLTSDPQKQCRIGQREGMPCYFVSIAGQGVISFGHAETGDDDRFIQNQTSNISPMEQMNAVSSAISEFIKIKQPPEISWYSVQKSRPGALNSNARMNIYDRWAERNLYPQYVPVAADRWLRQDQFLAYAQEKNIPIDQQFLNANNVKAFKAKFLSSQQMSQMPVSSFQW